jgi:RNA polymerase sigma-70 factor, ECF subfamily
VPHEGLVDEFLAAWGRGAPAASDALAEAIAGLVQRARAEEPTLDLSPAAFVRYVGERCQGAEAPLEHVASLRAGDLWLAFGCAAGHRRALRRFQDRFRADIEVAVTRSGNADVSPEDFRQHIFSKLFTAAGDAPPRIAEYGGRGSLRGWLRITIVRQVIDFVRRTQRRELGQQVDEAELLGLRAASADPELAYARTSFETELREALREGFASLSARERNLLRHFLIHGLGIDDVARIYDVHRATAHRWRLRAQQTLLRATRTALRSRLGTDTRELRNAMSSLQASHLHITIRRYLSRETEDEDPAEQEP